MALHYLDKKRKGFITLISVVLLTVISVSIVSVDLFISTDDQVATRTVTDSFQADYLSETCVEVALNKLKLSTSYTGNETITVSFGSCTISTVSGTGNTNRSFTTNATVGDTNRQYRVTVTQVNPTTTMSEYVLLTN